MAWRDLGREILEIFATFRPERPGKGEYPTVWAPRFRDDSPGLRWLEGRAWENRIPEFRDRLPTRTRRVGKDMEKRQAYLREYRKQEHVMAASRARARASWRRRYGVHEH